MSAHDPDIQAIPARRRDAGVGPAPKEARRAPWPVVLSLTSILGAPGSLAGQDGYRWSLVVPPGSGAFEDVWEPGRWPMGVRPVAGPEDVLWMVGIGTAWQSPDGLRWDVVGRLPTPARAGSASARHGNDVWLVGGQAGAAFTSGVWSSPDGRRWRRRGDGPWSGRRDAALVSFRGWLWLFGGESRAQLGDVWRTRDGTDWERVSHRSPWPTESQPVVVVFRDSLWAFGGTSWRARDADLWVSADGERWERVVDSAGWGPRVYAGILTFDDRLWILGGVRPDGRRLNDVWSSRDGREWRRVASFAPWTRRAGNRAVAYRGALWLFGGKGEEEDGESGYASDVWRLERAPEGPATSESDLAAASADSEARMADGVRGIPENSSVVIPRLFCREPAAEIDFCVHTFDAVELGRRPGPDGGVAHALMTIGPAMVMIEAEWPTLTSRAPVPDGSSPVVIFVYVEDVDETLERAVAGGARVLVPAQNQFWGDRIAWIMDPSGHVWTIATRIEDTTAEERENRWAEVLKSGRPASSD